MPVVPMPGLGIIVLTGESQVQTADCIERHGTIERIIVCSPNYRFGAIGDYLRPAQVVVVHIVQLLVSHQANYLTPET